MAKALAKESSAAAVAAWARAFKAASMQSSPRTAAALNIAQRNLLNNIPELRDMLHQTKEGYPYYQGTKDQTSQTPAISLPQR